MLIEERKMNEWIDKGMNEEVNEWINGWMINWPVDAYPSEGVDGGTKEGDLNVGRSLTEKGVAT